jgi:hypothetical protein
MQQRRLQFPRPQHDLAPGGAERLPAGEQRPLISPRIALPGLMGPVELGAVGLDDDPLLGPNEVTLDPVAVAQVDPVIDARLREAEPPADSQECLFQLALSERAAHVVLLEDRPQPRETGVGGIALELVVDGDEVEDAHAVRLVEHPLDGPPRQDSSEVENRSRDRRARDVVLNGDVAGRQAGRAVDVNPVTAAAGPAGNGHVELRSGCRPQAMEGRGVAVREDRPGTARKHCRHPISLTGQKRARNEGVDAGVDAVEASPPHSLANGAVRQPQPAQLVQPENRMLPRRQSRNRLIHPNLAEFRDICSRFSARSRHATHAPAKPVTREFQLCRSSTLET